MMDSAWVQPTTDSTMVWVDLRRTGSAAFLGSVVFELYRAGEEEPVWDTSPAALAVYRSLRRYYALDLSGVEPGDYRLRVRITTERTDIPQAVVLPAAPVERVLPLRLPPRPAGRPAPR